MEKYRAINNWIIGKRVIEDEVTESGIHVPTSSEANQVFALVVTSTTEETKDLQDKTVYLPRHKVTQLAEGSVEIYGSFKLEDIIAIKHG